MKIELRRRKPHPSDRPGGHVHITHSWPFFQNRPNGYVHRPREATMFFFRGEYSHTAVSFWCGGCGFPEGRSRLAKTKHRRESKFLIQPPVGSVVCATCEGRAIGSGQLGSCMIAGLMVKFSPRR